MCEIQCRRIGNIYNNDYGGSMAGNVFSPLGISPAVLNMGAGGGGQ